jgi:abortive infection Abi-like protein
MTDSPSDRGAFTMLGAREILDRTGAAIPITQQIDAIENAVGTSPGIVFDLARAIVESTCKTILTERGIDCAKIGINKLLESTYNELALVPTNTSVDQDTAEHFSALVAGFESIIKCLSHLRHTYGLCSHGKDDSTPSLEYAHALLAARSADALVHFLYAAHKFFFSPVVADELQYTANGEFNEYVDSVTPPIEILGVEYLPSDVLFRTDLEAYRNALFESSGALNES